jgi:hypothetical protein
MFIYREQSAGQMHSRSFESVSEFIHLGTTVTNQNCVREEIERSRCTWGMHSAIHCKIACLPIG